MQELYGRMIYQVQPTKEQVTLARQLIEESMPGKAQSFNGDKFQAMMGIIAQIIIADITGHSRPESTKEFDGGQDIMWQGLKWDVKCERRTCFFNPQEFVHNLRADQINYDCDGYFFVSYNCEEGIYELCGWIKKESFLKNASYFKGGTQRTRNNGTSFTVHSKHGMYEIKQEHLQSVPPDLMIAYRKKHQEELQ